MTAEQRWVGVEDVSAHLGVNKDSVYRLSIRARHVLDNLGIRDSSELLRLTRTDLMQARSCGKKTIGEIEELQFKLRPQNDHEPIPVLRAAVNFDKAPKAVFEAIQRNLGVRGAKTLESLGVGSLTSFMMLERKLLLNCRNCGRKTADKILQMQAGIADFALGLAQEFVDFCPEQLLDAPCLANITTSHMNTSQAIDVFADVENPATWLEGWIRDLARTPKEAKAFMLRKGMLGLAPMTLEQVGEKVGGVTRERARQMDKAVERNATAPSQQRRLRPLIAAAAPMVEQQGMLGLDELTRALLCRGKEGHRLKFATELISFFSTLQVWKDAGLLLQKDGVVISGASRHQVRQLAAVFDEIALTAADEQHARDLWSIDRERLKVALHKGVARTSGNPTFAKVSDALLDTVLKQRRKQVKAHKDRVYSLDLWRLQFGRVIDVLDTVLHSIAKPAHFSEITEQVGKWRPGISEHNVYATLERSKNALLWDHGTFIHKDNVVIPFSLIHDVEHWLLEMLTEDVPFVSINGAFLHFQARCERVAFPSEVALYTCLRLSAHPELLLPRFPCVYLKEQFTECIPMPVVLEDFLRDAGGPVSYQEVREFLSERIFLKDFKINQISQRVSNVIRTADWGYLHLDNAKFEIESIVPLIKYTQDVLTKEQHCSVDKIYLDKQVTCRSLGIDDPVMLYSLLQCLAEESISLNGYPRIARRLGQDEGKYSIRQRVLEFVRDTGKPCPHEILEERFVNGLGYREQQVYSVVRDAEVCMYHPGCVIHYQSLAWNGSRQQALESAALRIYEDATKAGTYFGRVSHLVESPDLPSLPSTLHWSRTMVADLLAKGGRYVVFGDSREAFVPRENENDIHSFESLVGKLLNRDWGGGANLADFEKKLVKEGIIRKRLSRAMLGNGDIVVVNDREIILKELLVDAQRP